jgi:hypothetical protein
LLVIVVIRLARSEAAGRKGQGSSQARFHRRTGSFAIRPDV